MLSVKKYKGKLIPTRGSNKSYPQLDDLDALLEMLVVDCPADVARKLGVPANCVRFLIDRWFTEEDKARVNWKRARHRKSK